VAKTKTSEINYVKPREIKTLKLRKGREVTLVLRFDYKTVIIF